MNTETVTIDSIIEVLDRAPFEGQASTALELINHMKTGANEDLSYGLDAAAGCLRAAIEYPEGAKDFIYLAAISLKLAKLLNNQ